MLYKFDDDFYFVFDLCDFCLVCFVGVNFYKYMNNCICDVFWILVIVLGVELLCLVSLCICYICFGIVFLFVGIL